MCTLATYTQKLVSLYLSSSPFPSYSPIPLLLEWIDEREGGRALMLQEEDVTERGRGGERANEIVAAVRVEVPALNGDGVIRK